MRTYVLTRGRTRPRHLLNLDTVLEAGPGRPGPGLARESEEILALCLAHPRSVAEVAGRLGRPVTVARILISDLLDAQALIVPVTAATYASSADAAPSTQLLAALAAGLKRKWPDALAYPEAG
ncbi:hypothetical protein DUI70_6999 [Streptomyces albus]|nr:hypothetical protein SLNHY_7114 [Streptomyces albus]AYN37492.1 hypothetical protein DUI70_6999 [Streptomyces albus]